MPLQDLTHISDDPFPNPLLPKALRSFEALKSAFTSPLVLQPFNPLLPLTPLTLQWLAFTCNLMTLVFFTLAHFIVKSGVLQKSITTPMIKNSWRLLTASEIGNLGLLEPTYL